MGELYSSICGSDHISTAACSAKLSKEAAAGHTPAALHFLGLSVNLTARSAQQIGGLGSAIPYYVLIALVAFTGWYQVRQTQARQLQSGNTPPNAQMAAMTKIFPVFFAFICFGLNAGATLYFVVSNAWRIGQQHLVIGKLYDQAQTTGGLKGTADDPPAIESGAKGESDKAAPNGNGKSKGSGDKGSNQKPSASSNGDANGNANGQSMSSGARRKKRKR
jgi:membrane protein insertase Oxa1/YidC/SpoIIIJ